MERSPASELPRATGNLNRLFARDGARAREQRNVLVAKAQRELHTFRGRENLHRLPRFRTQHISN